MAKKLWQHRTAVLAAQASLGPGYVYKQLACAATQVATTFSLLLFELSRAGRRFIESFCARFLKPLSTLPTAIGSIAITKQRINDRYLDIKVMVGN